MLDRSKSVGMLVGLAVGDALGAPLEFRPRRDEDNYVREYKTGGTHGVTIGEWTDDTAMAMAMADALIKNEGVFNASDIMDNFIAWKDKGEYIPRGVCFDIGNTTVKALRFYEAQGRKDRPYVGSNSMDSSGNGGIMRLAPAIIVADSLCQAVEYAVCSTMLTHASPECIKYARLLAEEIWFGFHRKANDKYRLPKNTPREDVMSGGYVKETFQAAWWCFLNTKTFEDCVIEAVNLGHDTDTTGAVAGMIAGAWYGIENIPKHFRDNLQWYDEIFKTAIQLYELRGKHDKLT